MITVHRKDITSDSMFFFFYKVSLCTCMSVTNCLPVGISEPTLNPKKAYEFRYEGTVNIGRGMPDLAESGVRLSCNAKITGISAQMYLLQVNTT